jgi:hypothetical protein
VRPTAVSSPASGSRYGSARGTVMRATMCAARYSARKKTAYVSDAPEIFDCSEM